MRRYHLFEPPLNMWSIADWNVFIMELRIKFPIETSTAIFSVPIASAREGSGRASPAQQEGVSRSGGFMLAVREAGAMAGHPPFVVSKAYLEGGNSGQRQI